MARVFLSHASEDHRLAAEVHGRLTDQGHEMFLDQDLRAGLAMGELWEQRLFERLRWADVVLCLVTSAYVASPWCAAEVGIASSRGSRLLPLRAQPGANHPLMSSRQYVDHARDPAAAWAGLGEALARLDAAGGRGWLDGRSPYRGCRRSRRTCTGCFSAATRRSRSSPSGCAHRRSGPVAVCWWWSGRRGAVSLPWSGPVWRPVMAEEPGWWTLPAFVPGADPVGALARELTGEARKLGLGWDLAGVPDGLEGDGLARLAEELLLGAPEGWDRRRLLIVVDQLEELLTQAPDRERARFAALLSQGLAGPVAVVATLRPEYLAQLAASPELAALRVDTFLLRPLRPEALPTVIEGPADLAGIGIETELVARLVADTGTGEALPLLAFTLNRLADGAERGDKLSVARYEELGGVRGRWSARPTPPSPTL